MDRLKLRTLLILEEGFKLKPYVDTVGKLTVGVGRNLTDRGISEETALQMLEEDLDVVQADMATFPWWAGLDVVRQTVLADMRFNLGPARFRAFKNTLKAVAEGRYADAAAGMLASKWAKQVKGRATKLAKMMETGTDA